MHLRRPTRRIGGGGGDERARLIEIMQGGGDDGTFAFGLLHGQTLFIVSREMISSSTRRRHSLEHGRIEGAQVCARSLGAFCA